MLEIKRLNNGSFVLSVPLTIAGVLRSLPRRIEDLLVHPEKNRDVIRRLFPAAHSDPKDEAEYRELLGNDLLQRKQEAMEAFRQSLDSAKKRAEDPSQHPEYPEPWLDIRIPASEFDFWLAFINDVRLMLGIELDIIDEGWQAPTSPGHPKAMDFALLHFLTFLEDELLRATGMLPESQ